MALVPSFSITPTTSPGVFTLTDTSTGSDGAVSTLVFTLVLASGTTLISSSVAYSAGISTTVTIAKDYALNVTASWRNSGGTQLYGTSLLYPFVEFAWAYLYSLVQTIQSSLPQSVLNDWTYFNSFVRLYALLQGAILAINKNSDINAAQGNILLYQILLQNPTLYF